MDVKGALLLLINTRIGLDAIQIVASYLSKKKIVAS